MMRNVVLGLALAAASGVSYAEIWAYARDKNIDFAILKANEAAANGARGRGTCMSHYGQEKYCKRSEADPSTWQCRAAFSKHSGSCKGKGWAADLKRFREEVQAFCNNQPEACAAAAKGGG